MEMTTCIMNVNGATCRGPKRKNLDMLMCANHLKEYYGLEMEYVVHEDQTNHILIGGFLKPVKGVIFKRNTVIIPTQKFFDQHFRPEDVESFEDISQYLMNPVIVELLRFHSINNCEGKLDKRYPIEILRNLTEANDVNTGPHTIQTKLLRNLITFVTSKKTVSSTQIMTQATRNYMEQAMVQGRDGNYISIDKLKISDIMKYILINCYFSLTLLRSEEPVLTDAVFSNVEWITNVGLVATEQIADPNYLVLDGTNTGAQTFYNAKLSIVPKQFIQKTVTPKDALPQYHMSNVFRGGSLDCLT